jgi:hypothetical protein
MKKQDILSILITFVAGFIAGIYLYVMGFTGIVNKIETSTLDRYEEFTVQGELYGGCRSRCDSFQILADGSYRYISYTNDTEASTLKQGNLPFRLRRELQDAVSVPQLIAQSRPDNKADCPSFTDGLDVRYEVTFRGTDYTLDSCTTQVTGESALWQALYASWGHMQEAGNSE